MRLRAVTVCIALALGVLTAPLTAQAQQPQKIPRIGFLNSTTPSVVSARIEAFRQGLRELGYAEGKNIVIEWRHAEGKADRLPALAAELVRLKVDVLVAGSGRAAVAAKQATSTIPIVVGSAGDLVGADLVASLARPGGNITGLTMLAPELGGKRLELLKEVVPRLSRVAVLGDRDSQSYGPQMKEMEVVARALGLQLQIVELRGPNDLENALSTIIRGRAGAITALRSPFINSQSKRIVELAIKSRLPAISSDNEFVDAGGLMSYGPNSADLFRRAATYVDKILKGTKPADLPVEQPMKFELVINLKTAKALGLTIPQSVLIRADHVIQ